MPDLSNLLNHILGAIFVIIVFSLAYAYLKPHMLHRSRRFSTALLKISYLAYFLILMIIIYISALEKGGLSNVFYGVEFFAFLFVLFIPTAGIFARKMEHFRKKREGYNYFFTVVNGLSIISILLMFFI
jgi:hypothetical protein